MKFRSLAMMALIATFGLWNVKAIKAADTPAERIEAANTVMKEVMGTPEKGIPKDLLDRAHCVAVIPGLKKGAFIVGGEWGKGIVTCRTPGERAGWSGPAAIRIEGGSFGFQIGGSETDLVLLIMNESGMRKLTKDKFTLGADASVAAGPVGRTGEAQTDVAMRAEILSYSRSRGLFAGVALKGATLRPDKTEDRKLYGSDVDQANILAGKVKPPAAARDLIATLNQYSPKETASSSER